MKRSSYRRAFGLFAGLCLVAAVGCHLLPSSPPSPTTASASKPDAEPKYKYTVPPFEFHSDVDLSRNQSMFEELSKLREKVVMDLQLPPSTARIQVRLFEDKLHYERFMK